MIFGADVPNAGDVYLDGERLPRGAPGAAISKGVAFAPADRQRLSAIPSWTLRENVTLPRLRTQGLLRWLGVRAERRDAAEWIKRLDVRPSNPERLFSTLSGGNQQRLVLARWLRSGAKALLLEEPTAGVDTGAKAAIHEMLADAARDGTAVMMIVRRRGTVR